MLHYWPLLLLIPNIIAIIDFLIRRPESFWFWVIVVFGPLGPVIYLIGVVLTKEGAVDVAGKIKGNLMDRRRAKELAAKAKAGEALPYDLYELGEFYVKTGRFGPAVEVLVRAIQKAPENTEGKFYLGISLEQLGEFEKAGRVLEQIVMRDPKFKFGEAMFALARCYKNAGETDAAVSAYSKVLEQSTFARARYELAELYLEKGEKAKAAEQLDTLIREVDSAEIPKFRKGEEKRWQGKAKTLRKTIRE